MGKGRSGFGGSGPDSRNWEAEARNGEIDGYEVLGFGNSLERRNQLMGNYEGGAAEKWYDGLSDSEKKAVDIYTRNGFEPMNEYLRGLDDSPTEGVKKAINNLESALGDYDLPQDTIFHRVGGEALLEGANTVEAVRKKIGKEVVDPGFTSTAVQLNGTIEREFSFGAEGTPMRLHIKTPKGKGAGAFLGKNSSSTFSENEFLFNKGSRFKVLGAYEKIRNPGKPWQTTELHVNLKYMGRKK